MPSFHGDYFVVRVAYDPDSSLLLWRQPYPLLLVYLISVVLYLNVTYCYYFGNRFAACIGYNRLRRCRLRRCRLRRSRLRSRFRLACSRRRWNLYSLLGSHALYIFTAWRIDFPHDLEPLPCLPVPLLLFLQFLLRIDCNSDRTVSA